MVYTERMEASWEAHEAAADGSSLDPALAAVWRDVHDEVVSQVAVVEDAVAAFVAGTLDDDLREHGRREAHKLAGSVATFGFARAGTSARELELAFARALPHGEAPRLAEHALVLRRDLAGGPGGTREDGGPNAAERGARLLVAGLPADDVDALRRAASRRGWAVVTDRRHGGHVPLALLGESSAELPAQLAALSRRDGGDPAPAIAIALSHATEVDRVELLDAGASRFLPAGLSPERTLDELAELDVRRKRERATVVALDDDPAILELLDATLGAAGHELLACQHASELWSALSATVPDLLVLDVDLPDCSGVDLCRALRADERLRALPVLFLTGVSDASTVAALFAAGADDYVAKPVLGPELLARVETRIARSRLHRRLAEVDALTGLARRERAAEQLSLQLTAALRLDQPLALALLTVDQLAEIDDRHGAAAGDAALSAAAAAIARTCGPDETAARWAGGQLLVGMLGLDEHGARSRIGDLLEAVRADEPVAGERLTLSAGVACHPRDGVTVDVLERAARDARHRAAADGGDRLAVAGDDRDADPEHTDVVLVEDDRALAPLVVHALETRGYRVRWIDDGDEAAHLLGGADPELTTGLLLLDWDLPARDGLTILRGLAADGVLARTRVIMLTGRTTQREVLATLELGADDHVAKPFGVPILMQKVRRLLGR